MPDPSLVSPTEAAAEHGRGLAFAKQRRFANAIDCFRKAIRTDPNLFAAQANLGALLADQGLAEEALAALRSAHSLKPDNPSVHLNLAILLTDLGQPDAATDHCRRSLALRPSNPLALNALGNVLKNQGLLDEALEAYARAADLAPDLPQPASNYLYLMHFHPAQSAAMLLAAHRNWARRFAPNARTIQSSHENDRDPNRRLKIGLVSPDFREHPVGRFILPILQNHDRARIEFFCYANLHACDAMTDRIRAAADGWRDIIEQSDEQAASAIRSDRIDILVDLTMHMRSNRLSLFTMKPAPVQATYLAYCSTTGIEAIDYRLTDAFLDPPGTDEFYVERSIRLPRSYWCYQANDAAPAINDLPAFRNGGCVTFACLNNFCKVTSFTLSAWAKLLQIVPNSRLILHAGEGKHRDRAREALGVNESRIRFVSRSSMPQYFEQYHEIDLAFDPFPCTGGTTTLDALWMGVPVVSLAGQTAVSRGGLSILSNIGRREWVATTASEYMTIAAALAADLPKLAAIRASLRDQMRRSPIMDAHQFSTDLESSFRQMWHQWCASC